MFFFENTFELLLTLVRAVFLSTSVSRVSSSVPTILKQFHYKCTLTHKLCHLWISGLKNHRFWISYSCLFWRNLLCKTRLKMSKMSPLSNLTFCCLCVLYTNETNCLERVVPLIWVPWSLNGVDKPCAWAN